jgi:hypothetical protein
MEKEFLGRFRQVREQRLSSLRLHGERVDESKIAGRRIEDGHGKLRNGIEIIDGKASRAAPSAARPARYGK